MIDSVPGLAAVVSRGQSTFESENFADRMGNTANIAYGGSTLAFAVNCAASTVESKYHLYSAVGNFLGPVLTDRKMFCTVHNVRDTKAFATRDIRVNQTYPDGTSRLVLTMFADFQVAEPASVLNYSAKPSTSYSTVDQNLSTTAHRARLVEAGHVSEQEAALFERLFHPMDRYFDLKPCPEGITAQNLNSLAKHRQTTQDHLPLVNKTSADWYKHRRPLQTQSDNLCAMFYLMDAALSFMPLAHSHLSLTDAAACSSLDFALRVFSNNLSIDQWHLKEMKTVTGGNGRTYSEARLWDEAGNMVASMTQQCILRPLKPSL